MKRDPTNWKVDRTTIIYLEEEIDEYHTRRGYLNTESLVLLPQISLLH